MSMEFDHLILSHSAAPWWSASAAAAADEDLRWYVVVRTATCGFCSGLVDSYDE